MHFLYCSRENIFKTSWKKKKKKKKEGKQSERKKVKW
jgi:hypothetical protein